jgi:uncharacterized RDD family membrane protein YckC
MTYYFSDGKEKFGPMSPEDATRRVLANPGGRNYVWKPGMAEWAAPDALEEIRALLEAAMPPFPPQPPETMTPPETTAMGFTNTASASGLEQMSESGTAPSPENAGEAANDVRAAQHVTDPHHVRPEAQSLDARNTVDLDSIIVAERRAEKTDALPGTTISYAKCNIGKRIGAWLIDSLIVGVFLIPSIIILITAFNEPRLTFPLLLLSIMLLFPSIIYSFIRDGLGQGQSWGKQLLNLMVVDLKSNEPCSKGKSFVRNVIGFLLSLFPYIGWLVEPIIVLADDKGRRLGDRAAETMVIERDQYSGRLRNTLRA